uniref:subtilisin n=1 Tax=Albugo laibachii Nc14 TaxID=890382 RepID=F0WJQ2_9STRA|nr:serine protease putative [Albugo laibachii Nc14]|eukprot:CCA21503.1 serine protease putative [Albugo laibachii Nc14]
MYGYVCNIAISLWLYTRILNLSSLLFAKTVKYCQYRCPVRLPVGFIASECWSTCLKLQLQQSARAEESLGRSAKTCNAESVYGTNFGRVGLFLCASSFDTSTLCFKRQFPSILSGPSTLISLSTVSAGLSRLLEAYESLLDNGESFLKDCDVESNQTVKVSQLNRTELNENDVFPVIVYIDPGSDTRRCILSIQSLWNEAIHTTLLARQTHDVVMLHLRPALSGKVRNLACVYRIRFVPPLIKLVPLARSAARWHRRKDTALSPSLEIRLLHGRDVSKTLNALQEAMIQRTGIRDFFHIGNKAKTAEPRRYGSSIHTSNAYDVQTWLEGIAVLLLYDDDIEWVDEKLDFEAHFGQFFPFGSQLGTQVDDNVHALMGVTEAQEKGIFGNEIIVGITDTGLYINHDQFDQSSRSIYEQSDPTARKVVYYNPWQNRADESEQVVCGHGTHVAGILAGSSYSRREKDLGIARNARIAFMDIGTQNPDCANKIGCSVQLEVPADASELLRSQTKVGARIFSLSWGTGGNDYSVQARDLDAYLYENPDVLLVIAAGNSGGLERDQGQRTISSPSGAKNVISVGASLNTAETFRNFHCPSLFNERTVAYFSSAGPTTDGRLKPDVVAPGMLVTSSQSEPSGSVKKSKDICSLQGTSQATPAVTGMAVLLYEWLRDGWWKNGRRDYTYKMDQIPAALLKALIIHSSESLALRMAPLPHTGTFTCAGTERKSWPLSFPDVYQGYGKPKLSNIATFAFVNTSSSFRHAESAKNVTTLPVYFLPNSTEGSEPRVAHQQSVSIAFMAPKNVDLRVTIAWTDPPGSLHATSQLQHDLDLSVRIRGSDEEFYPVTVESGTKRDRKNNVEMVQVAYTQLLRAARTAETKAASLSSFRDDKPDNIAFVNDAGEILVEAIIYGHSILLADSQAFAFVASSSVIGSVIREHDNDPNHRMWRSWIFITTITGALMLVLIIALTVGKVQKRKETLASMNGNEANTPSFKVHEDLPSIATTLTSDRPTSSSRKDRISGTGRHATEYEKERENQWKRRSSESQLISENANRSASIHATNVSTVL